MINILQDYQMAYLSDNGLAGMLQFDLTGNKLDMTAFSAGVQSKDHAKLTQFDELLPAGAGDSYSVDINFDKRFAGFNEAWAPGETDRPDYTAALKRTVSGSYVPLQISEPTSPAPPRTTHTWRAPPCTGARAWPPSTARVSAKAMRCRPGRLFRTSRSSRT